MLLLLLLLLVTVVDGDGGAVSSQVGSNLDTTRGDLSCVNGIEEKGDFKNE